MKQQVIIHTIRSKKKEKYKKSYNSVNKLDVEFEFICSFAEKIYMVRARFEKIKSEIMQINR